MISQETIDQVISSTSITDIVSSKVSLKQAGSNLLGLCPFHNEKTPSFNVREADGYYHCFGCGASGNAISFIMEQEGLSFPDTIEYLASLLGIAVKHETGTKRNSSSSSSQKNKKVVYEINHKACEFFLAQLQEADDKVKEYLKSRNLSEEIVQKFSIGFCSNNWSKLSEFLSSQFSEKDLLASGLVKKGKKSTLYDVFRGRLIFPIFVDSKRIAGFGGRVVPACFSSEDLEKTPKYLNSPETLVYQKSKILYGVPQSLESARESGFVYITEGYMDVIALHKVGVSNALATCGTAITSEHLKKIKSLCNKASFLFDGDSAGIKSASSVFSKNYKFWCRSLGVLSSRGRGPRYYCQ